MFIATNTRQAAGCFLFDYEYFELVFLKILPSANMACFPRNSHMCTRIINAISE